MYGAVFVFSRLCFSWSGFVYFRSGIEGKAPQEAIIGIVYAVATAASILAVSHSPEGAEHIQHLLVGSILTVTPAEVIRATLIFAGIGAFHWLSRSKFIPLTFSPNAHKVVHRLWDFLFYATFAVMVTTAVKICGVLLVFIFLVVPGVFGSLVAERFSRRLMMAWTFGVTSSVLGLMASFWFDTPTGATIVCMFGLLLLIYAGGRLVRRRIASQI